MKIMLYDPIYDERIIVGVVYNNKFNWYITNKLFWILDFKKITKDDYDVYFKDKEVNEVRKDIITLSNDNIELFLDRLEKYKVDINVLRLKILKKIESQGAERELEEYYPALLIDFDKEILYSQYSEPFGFENYIPDNWEGKYISFVDYVESENRYWIYKNVNLLI
jgi:hypothetical protein